MIASRSMLAAIGLFAWMACTYVMAMGLNPGLNPHGRTCGMMVCMQAVVFENRLLQSSSQ